MAIAADPTFERSEEPMKIDFVAGHSYRSDELGPGSTVVDLGLNTGEFALELIRRHGCRVIGVEPLKAPLAQIPADDRVIIERAAISAERTPVTIYEGASTCPTTDSGLAPRTAARSTAAAITLEDLFEKHGLMERPVDLVKVDIEGAELEMLASAPESLLRNIEQFTVEYHDFLDPAQRPLVDRAHRRLDSLGFQRLNISRTPNLDVIYLGPSQHLSRVGRLWVAARYRYVRGTARVCRRMLLPGKG
jgi:FkbM family methyltransferase